MPSFATDSPLDYKIKRGLVLDVLKTLSLTVRRRNLYKTERKAKLAERTLKPAKTLAAVAPTTEKKDDTGKQVGGAATK